MAESGMREGRAGLRSEAPLARLPTGWRGRLAAIAIIFALLGCVYLLAVLPLLDLYADRQAVLNSRRMLAAKMSAVEHQLPRLQASLTTLREALSARKIVLDGGTDTIASAGLAERIKQLAESAGAVIDAAEALPPQKRGNFRQIRLRITLNGDYQSLVRLLGAIETNEPPLVIADLELHALMLPGGKPTTSKINARFEVFGFRGSEIPQ